MVKKMQKGIQIKRLLLLVTGLLSSKLLCEEYSNKIYAQTYDFTLSSGYVWKSDFHFKNVYGSGIPNLITADICYWLYEFLGLGIKSAYWEKTGRTTVFQQHARIQEVPLILYLKGGIGDRIRGYFALGGGVIFAKERSYLGKIWQIVPGGDIELGVNCFIIKQLYVTAAFDYLFFYKQVSSFHGKRDFGGYGFRLGLGTGF